MLLKFIPRYFIIFDAIINGIVFLICLSDSLLLVYRNATNFSILIFYPAAFLNSYVHSNSFFLMESSGFSMCNICHLQIETILLLPIWMCFIPPLFF